MDQDNGYLSEESAGFAAPALDLAAAIALIALSIWVMVESAQMRMPAGIASAPGLLPFVTAALLALMSVFVAWQAVSRRGEGWLSGSTLSTVKWQRTLLILAVISLYVLTLQLAAFERSFVIGGWRFTVGSFEAVSPVAMTILLAVFWRKPLAACFALSALYILILAQTFRLLFGIPLWG